MVEPHIRDAQDMVLSQQDMEDEWEPSTKDANDLTIDIQCQRTAIYVASLNRR
jgi:hypothetical protein